MSSVDARVLEIVGELQDVTDLPELRSALIRTLRAAIPCEWVSLNAIGPSAGDVWFVSDPPVPEQFHEPFRRLAYENPLVARLERTRDGRAYRFSDVIGRPALEALELYRTVYRPLGVEHQIAFTLPSPRGHILGVALCRRDADFSDLEREVLNRARPFLIQLYRNAMAFGALRTAVERREPTALDDALADTGLTPRELEVVRFVALGRSNQQIADELNLSVRTVHKHLEHAFRKLGVSSRAEAAARVWSALGA